MATHKPTQQEKILRDNLMIMKYLWMYLNGKSNKRNGRFFSLLGISEQGFSRLIHISPGRHSIDTVVGKTEQTRKEAYVGQNIFSGEKLLDIPDITIDGQLQKCDEIFWDDFFDARYPKYKNSKGAKKNNPELQKVENALYEMFKKFFSNQSIKPGGQYYEFKRLHGYFNCDGEVIQANDMLQEIINSLKEDINLGTLQASMYGKQGDKRYKIVRDLLTALQQATTTTKTVMNYDILKQDYNKE